MSNKKINLIIDAACSEYNVSRKEFFSTQRTRNISEARKAVCYFLRYIGMSVTEISVAINRDRTSIYSNLDSYDWGVTYDSKVKAHKESIYEKLKIDLFMQTMSSVDAVLYLKQLLNYRLGVNGAKEPDPTLLNCVLDYSIKAMQNENRI